MVPAKPRLVYAASLVLQRFASFWSAKSICLCACARSRRPYRLLRLFVCAIALSWQSYDALSSQTRQANKECGGRIGSRLGFCCSCASKATPKEKKKKTEIVVWGRRPRHRNFCGGRFGERVDLPGRIGYLRAPFVLVVNLFSHSRLVSSFFKRNSVPTLSASIRSIFAFFFSLSVPTSCDEEQKQQKETLEEIAPIHFASLIVSQPIPERLIPLVACVRFWLVFASAW